MQYPWFRRLSIEFFKGTPLSYLCLALHYSGSELCYPKYKWKRHYRLKMKECCRSSRWYEFSEKYYREERVKEMRARYCTA